MPISRDLLSAWYERTSVTQKAHYLTTEHFRRRHYWLGIPAIVLSTAVGTSVFATLQKRELNPWLQVAVGLASVLAAVLAGLQTFFGYSERAEKHRTAGARYGALGRELEAMLATTEPIADEAVADLRKRLDALALEAPNNPERIYRKAGPEVERSFQHRTGG